MLTRKRTIIIVLIIFLSVFLGFWSIVSEGYDKQNKTILFIKKFIPSKIARKVRDTIFIIPNLKEQNLFLRTVIQKHDQGFKGELFKKKEILSEKSKKKYNCFL